MKKIAWILGGSAVLSAAMIAASLGACSNGDTSFTDAGKDSTARDTGTPDTGNVDTGTPDTGIQDAGPDCKTPKGPFSTDAGPYCPFMADDAGGTGLFASCATGEHCCVYKTTGVPSTCNAGGTACNPGSDAGTADFACEESNDCPNGQVCCLQAPAYLAQDPGCTSYYFISGLNGHGTYCATSCAANEAQICGSDSDCANQAGTTCQHVNTKGIWIGACK